MTGIKIKHFGPIRNGYEENEGFLTISPLTIFCGNQATGKSTIAKLYSTFSWLEKTLCRGDYDLNQSSSKKFLMGLLRNQGISEYMTPKTELSYSGEAYKFEFKDGLFSILKADGINSYVRPQIMYTPSERNFLSAIEKAGEYNKLPLMLSIYLEEYRKAETFFADTNYEIPINGIKINYNSAFGRLYAISKNGKKVAIEHSSSGIQSITPLCLVLDYLLTMILRDDKEKIGSLSYIERQQLKEKIYEAFPSSEAKILEKEFNMLFTQGYVEESIKREEMSILLDFLHRYLNNRLIFIVEEPEQNLYPTSQQNLLKSLIKTVHASKGNSVLITTHSPYLINYLSLIIKGDELKEKGFSSKKIDKVLKTSETLDSLQYSIYETHNDGSITMLDKIDGIPSDANLLNTIMEDSNEVFASLLELEMGAK